MEMENIDEKMANALCRNFSEKAQEMGASVPTMMYAAIGLFTVMLKCITVTDPETGRRKERMLKMAPEMIAAYMEDNSEKFEE